MSRPHPVRPPRSAFLNTLVILLQPVFECFVLMSIIRLATRLRLARKIGKDAGVSLDYLKELLTKANEAADKSARSKKLAAEVTEMILRPIEERVGKLSGPETEHLGGTSSTKPQFIAEYRCEVPEREELIPQLRFALENEKKKHALLEIGVTIGQAWTDPKTEEHYPAHIRWGAFCLAADKVKRVQGPLRVINRFTDDAFDVITPRPVTNKAGAMLSMVGKVKTLEELEGIDSFESLADEIAQDLCTLSTVVIPAPVEEEESQGESAEA